MPFEDHSRGPELLAIFGTGTGVAAILVILRLWVRIRILRKVGTDDCIVFVSLVNLHIFHMSARRWSSKLLADFYTIL